MKNLLKGRVYFVTGCSSGIGLAATKLLLLEGAHVFGVSRSSQHLSEVEGLLKETLSESMGRFVFFRGDVTIEAEVESALMSCKEQFAELHGAFNCAGILGEMCPIDDTKIESFEEVVASNLKSVFLCLKHEIRMAKSYNNDRDFSIVNCASAAAERGFPLGACYAASKAGVVSLTQSAARELEGTSIRVNALLPGGTLTNMTVQAQSKFPQWVESGSRKTPLGRFADPAEIAEAALFLLSGRSSYMTGSSLRVDGGVNV